MVDPLAEKYQNFTPFAYVGNNPINSYDGDGRKIIYVNGYFNFFLNLLGFAPGFGKQDYWKHFDSTFIPSSRQFLGATNSELNEFVDASSIIGGDQSGMDRYELGMKYAEENYQNLLYGMKEGETLKL